MKSFLLVAVVASWCAISADVGAQTVLLSWDVNGVTADATAEFAGTPALHLSGGNLTLGSGITASSAASTFGGSGFNQSSLATALANGDYLSFTISPATGYSLSIASLDYLVGKASSSTSFTVFLTSSQTGFDADNILDTYTFTVASPGLHSITLSGVTSLQNITSTTEFRLYGVSSSTDTFRIRNNSGADLVIKGMVSAVPEPATTAGLVGLLALLGCWLRKRSGRTAVMPAHIKKPAV